MNKAQFTQALEASGHFEIRRIVERLREGLFDSAGIQLLTMNEEKLEKAFNLGFKRSDQDTTAHLCIQGAYGQGKSHSLTFLRKYAHSKGFVTSQINLDPRETPFSNLKLVYQNLVSQIQFPDGGTDFIQKWEAWSEQWLDEEGKLQHEELFSEEIPHRLKCILTALAQKELKLATEQKVLRKYEIFYPKEIASWLSQALHGENLPVPILRNAFKYRQVSFYKEEPLGIKGWEPYIQMIQALSILFQWMGYEGWVLLLDEGESMIQGSILSRSKSYEFLYQLLIREEETQENSQEENGGKIQEEKEILDPGVYPVFAFTDDFFMKLQEEDYAKARITRGEEKLYFAREYQVEFQDLEIYKLPELSTQGWGSLVERLIALHHKAYRWNSEEGTSAQSSSSVQDLKKGMKASLQEHQHLETRLRLKGLVDFLDVVHQKEVLKL